MLEEQDAKAIADLMMGGDGNGPYAQMELGELHMSAVSEAMNQMMGASATSLVFPPIDPINTASLFLAISKASSVKGSP